MILFSFIGIYNDQITLLSKKTHTNEKTYLKISITPLRHIKCKKKVYHLNPKPKKN